MASTPSASRILTYRAQEPRLVAGVMSGTSLDGIDVALVEISGTGTRLNHRLRGFRSRPIEAELKRRLLAASAGEMTLREAFQLDAELGAIYADAITDAMSELGISTVDAIGLHGQTIYHDPRREPAGLSAQIGSGAIVSQRLGAIVVNDFRSADVAAGGEGAPLVPYCDYVLLHSPARNRVSLNIGGIANITWLPCEAELSSLIAFDTGPGNMLIDAAMRALYGRDYDEAGATAAAGEPDASWVAELLTDEYFGRVPPKSAGRERFGEERGKELVREGRARGLSDESIVASLTLLTARSIARAIVRFASRDVHVDEVIVGGGGARNRAMMRMLCAELPGTLVLPGDDFDVPADAKEALCFAILANEALCETPANVPSVTGAVRPVICGAIRIP